MGDELTSWERTYYEPGGGVPFLYYVVFGELPDAPTLSRTKYRSDGIPAGLELHKYDNQTNTDVRETYLSGYLWDQLLQEDENLAKVVDSSRDCLVIRGSCSDSNTLDYFRDTIGLVTALLDQGGVSVFDPQMFRWWSANEWRTHVFEPDGPAPRRHVTILVSEEAREDERWYHTRGLRKFGRPDLSVHRVTPDYEEGVIELFSRFIELQTFGGVVAEGQEVRIAGLPDGMTCHHRGDLDDPDFNNVHLDIEWYRPTEDDWSKLSIDLEGLDCDALLEPWRWLVPEEYRPFGMTAFGDWFFQDQDGRVFFLDLVSGTFEEIADSRSDFLDRRGLPSYLEQWYMVDLAMLCFENGMRPGSGQCLGFKVAPVVGGDVSPENVEVTSVAVEQAAMAQIHEQTKDLPVGTVINRVVLDGEES